MDYLKKIYKNSFYFKSVVLCLLVSFGSMSIIPATAFAQTLSVSSNFLPLSPSFTPTLVRGIRVYPDNPLKFDFIVDSGDSGLKGEELKKESEKLIRYFLASLTLPEDELWVNLSPYEKDRITPDALGSTEMGIDMLSQDYLLKQITASLTNPDSDLGKEFWSKIYKKAYEQYGTTNIPVDTFNKVWIMPSKAQVYVQDDKAFIIESKLKVMLEEDYLALERYRDSGFGDRGSNNENRTTKTSTPASTLSSSIVREVFIPALEKEVNTGKNFAQLRQIYNCIILSYWYKTNLKNSILNKVYSDKKKIKGLEIVNSEKYLASSQKSNEKPLAASSNSLLDTKYQIPDTNSAVESIYQSYLNTFKQGVCNMMKVEYDPYARKSIPRKYFAGGVTTGNIKDVFEGTRAASSCNAILSKLKLATIILITTAFSLFGSENNLAWSKDLKDANNYSVNEGSLGQEPFLLVDDGVGNESSEITPIPSDSIIHSERIMINDQEVSVVFSKEDRKIFGETFDGGKEIHIYLGSIIRNTQKTLDSIFVKGSSLDNVLDSATLSGASVQDLGVDLAVDLARLVLIHEAAHQRRFENDFGSQHDAGLNYIFRGFNIPEEMKRGVALELEAYLTMLCSGDYSKLIFIKLALMQSNLENSGKEEFYVSKVIAKNLLDRLGYRRFVRKHYRERLKEFKTGNIYRDFILIKEFLKNIPDIKLQEKAFYFYRNTFLEYPIIDVDFDMGPIKIYIKEFQGGQSFRSSDIRSPLPGASSSTIQIMKKTIEDFVNGREVVFELSMKDFEGIDPGRFRGAKATDRIDEFLRLIPFEARGLEFPWSKGRHDRTIDFTLIEIFKNSFSALRSWDDPRVLDRIPADIKNAIPPIDQRKISVSLDVKDARMIFRVIDNGAGIYAATTSEKKESGRDAGGHGQGLTDIYYSLKNIEGTYALQKAGEGGRSIKDGSIATIEIPLERLTFSQDIIRQDKNKAQYKPSGSSSVLTLSEQKAIEALKRYLEEKKIYALSDGLENFQIVVKIGPLFDEDDPHRVDIYLRDANGQETENALLLGFFYPEQKEFVLDGWNPMLEQTFFISPLNKEYPDLSNSADFKEMLEALRRSKNKNAGRRSVNLSKTLVAPQIFKIFSEAIPGFMLSGSLRDLQFEYGFGSEIFYDEESGLFKKKKGLGRDGYYWIVEKLSDAKGVAIGRDDEIVTIGQFISRDIFDMDEGSFLNDAQLCWLKMSDGVLKEEVAGFQNSLKRLVEYFDDASMEAMIANEGLSDPLLAGTGSLELGELWFKAKIPSAASSGLSGSWKEITPELLKLAKEKKVKVVFIDLDNTMFYPKGYVGSEKQKTESIIDMAVNLILKSLQGQENMFVGAEQVNSAIRQSKAIVYPQGDRDEKRMIDHQFFASDADLDVLRSLKKMGVNIIGFTARPSVLSKMRITLDILRALEINGDIFDKVIFTSGDGKIKANRLASEIKEYREEFREKGKQVPSKEIFLIDDLKKNIISAKKLGYGISLVLVEPRNGTDKIAWEEFVNLAKEAKNEKNLNHTIEYLVNAYMVAPRDKEEDVLLFARRSLDEENYNTFTQTLKSDDGKTEIKDIIRPDQRMPSGVINVDELRDFVKDQLNLSQDFSADHSLKTKKSSSSILGDLGIDPANQKYFSAFGEEGQSRIVSMAPQESFDESLERLAPATFFRIRPGRAEHARPYLEEVSGVPLGWQSWDTNLALMQQSLNIDLIKEIKLFRQSNPNKRMVVVDWGCGTGRALNDLAKKLRKENIVDVELIGFGDMLSLEWLKGDPSVTFFAGTSKDLFKFFFYTEKKADLIISLDGLNWIKDLGSYIEEDLLWVMSEKGKIIFNPRMGSEIEVDPEFFDSEFIERPIKSTGEHQVVTRKEISFPSELAADDQLGGIDFNAQNMNVKAKGQEIEFALPNATAQEGLVNAQGLVPVIINIVPVANVYHLLGLSSPEGLRDQTKPPIDQESSNLAKEPAKIRS